MAAIVLLSLAWIPASIAMMHGWGALTGLTVHAGLGDSPVVSLNDGYQLILMDGGDGFLRRDQNMRQPVRPIVSVGETPTHFYGLTRSGAFAVHKASGDSLEADSLEALECGPFRPGELSPVHQFPGRPTTPIDLVLFALILFGPPVAAWKWVRREPRTVE